MDKDDWYTYNKSSLMRSIASAYEEMAHNLGEDLKIHDETGMPVPETVGDRDDPDRMSNLEVLVQSFGLNPFERNILLICAGVQVKDKYGKLVSRWQENSESVHPGFGLMLKGLSDPNWAAISSGSPLFRWNLMHMSADSVLVNSSLKIDESVLHYLLGIHQLSKSLEPFVSAVKIPFYLSDMQAEQVREVAKNIRTDPEIRALPVMKVKGRNHLTAAMALCNHFGLELYKLNPGTLGGTREDLSQVVRLWNRDAGLKGYAIYLDTEGLEDNSRYRADEFIDGVSGLIFVHGSYDNALTGRDEISLALANPTREEQVTFWENAMQYSAKGMKESYREVVDSFDLDFLTIHNIARRINIGNGEEKLSGKDKSQQLRKSIWNGCRDVTRPSLGELAYLINVRAGWDDIVLVPEHMAVLREIVNQVRHRHKVYKEWKFSEKYTRGLGISALFTGESGTGKTMAAEVIANELKMDLYRIDLSQVINKYIGETEKNIRKIFDAAEQSGVILLFDEADTLFGRRSEVKDSHDRYSNIQLGYLLQRMEEYTGLAILTTNMKQSIDKAFERRIRFTLHFERPDTKLRKSIWRKMFPEASEVNGLNFDKLARINVPGGNIRNISLNAAFHAAAEGKSIGMKNILHATKMEYAKMEKALSRNEIKDWV
ncbi:MAG: ATP-binding protein [Cyclobacteriaceae bacterium]